MNKAVATRADSGQILGTAGEPTPLALNQTITIGRSCLQHGKASDRVYLMAAADEDMPGLLTAIEELAAAHRYGKIFAKVPARWGRACTAAGYRVEAKVPGFYQGREDGLFLGKYLKPGRAELSDRAAIERTLDLCRQTTAKDPGAKSNGLGSPAADDQSGGKIKPPAYRLGLCAPTDCAAMAALFRRVFPSYPFPVHDPGFLRRSMSEEVSYAAAWHQEQIAALASAEYSAAASHVEMTDFATLPEHRRRQLAGRLLAALEQEMQNQGIKLAYTIARAVSVGINLTFARAGYQYAGTLINNTQICGRIESMNVWYRRLQ